ncbi:ATP-grasp fold amidoligase family protein [Natronospora cellulosivora (SeqCode)]
MIQKIIRAIKNPKLIILFLMEKKMFRIIPDSVFLKFKYRVKMGKRLNINNPINYNEKLQWLKLNYRIPNYSNLVDKYKVRDYIKKNIGNKYLIPLLGIYNNFEEIDFDSLPNQFVIKPTHTSGDIYICKDKSDIDLRKLKRKIDSWLNKNYFWVHREWPYKKIKPRIICEKYMFDDSGGGLKDYKFFCFNGEPKAMFVATNRGIDTRFDFFDLNFNKYPVVQHYKNATKKIEKPIGFETMIQLSKKLSSNMPHVRVDFYDINGDIYFGELTFYHFSGFEMFEPDTYDEIFGSWLKLPKPRG